MAQQKFPSAGEYSPNHEDIIRRILTNITTIMSGKLNNTGEITVLPATIKTNVVLSPGQLTNTTVIPLMPTTANAAIEVGAGTVYVSTINATNATVGSVPAYSFELTHSTLTNTAVFKYLMMG